jgi:hypothetical protein
MGILMDELQQAQAAARDATDVLFALVRAINGAYEAQQRVRFLQQQAREVASERPRED